MKLAEQSGLPDPDLQRFKYRCPVPTSRESAIVMLADSVEAAMKSTGTNQIDEAERLIRRLIKTKNEQDQLIHSGMSFEDVETLIQAFLQVYAGHFHERVKYPDDHSVRQPTV
jgi:cyclic-di-AMP phosphodiesterase PgpH